MPRWKRYSVDVHPSSMISAAWRVWTFSLPITYLFVTFIGFKCRYLKKEAECCLKQLICNIVVVDHNTPRILRSVNPRLNKKLDNHVEHLNPTVADMLGLVLVLSHSSNEIGSTTTQSSLGLESPDYRSSLSITDVKSSSSYIHFNSQYFPQRTSKRESYISSPLKIIPQSPSKGFSFHINQQPLRAREISLDGKRRSYSCPLQSGIGKKENSFLH